MEAPARERHDFDQLHLNLPLISTRRPSGAPADPDKSSRFASLPPPDTSRRVPFQWERTPGVPKDAIMRELQSSKYVEDHFWPPKPPPGRWYPQGDQSGYDDDGGNDGGAENWSETSNADDDETFSDAFNELSLEEYLTSKDTKGSEERRAPSFIMTRFLPAANALAAASVPGFPKRSSRPQVERELAANPHSRRKAAAVDTRKAELGYTPRVDARHCSPAKGRKLMLLFPWSLKRTLCGLRSPLVQSQTPKANLEEFARGGKKFASDGSGWGDDGLSCKATKSPAWGLPFLDTSRLRIKGSSSVDRGKGRSFMVEREAEVPRGPMRSLPKLKAPSEPWLSHALNSLNRRY